MSISKSDNQDEPKEGSANFIKKLAVGTAQFGMDYGISNEQGQTAPSDVNVITRSLWEEGVRVFDTAPAYGDSEKVLGKAISKIRNSERFDRDQYRIVTKTIHFRHDRLLNSHLSEFEETFTKSLSALQVSYVDALLVHDARDLLKLGNDLLWDELASYRDQGLAKKIGVSVYSVEELEQIVAKRSIDIVQLPYNLCDQRFQESGCLKELQRLGIEVHSRSVFLQGLLLIEPKRLPEYFEPFKPMLTQWWNDLKERGITPFSAALSFVLRQPNIDYVVVGASNIHQWKEILDVARSGGIDVNIELKPSKDPKLINPSVWEI